LENLKEADIAVLHDVFLAFRADEPLLAQDRLLLVLIDLDVGVDVGLDEAFSNRLWMTRRLRGLPAGLHGPGAHFVLARGEKDCNPKSL